MKWRWVWKEPVCFSVLTEWKKRALCAQCGALITSHLHGGEHKTAIEAAESQIYLRHNPRLTVREIRTLGCVCVYWRLWGRGGFPLYLDGSVIQDWQSFISGGLQVLKHLMSLIKCHSIFSLLNAFPCLHKLVRGSWKTWRTKNASCGVPVSQKSHC